MGHRSDRHVTGEGPAAVFIAVDHCYSECVGIHAQAQPTASRLWSRSARACAGTSATSPRPMCPRPRGAARPRIEIMSDHFQNEIAFLGIESSPAFVRAPEGNGCAERFIRTLKENLLWVRHFETIEELRLALLDFREIYNATWLIELKILSFTSRPPISVRDSFNPPLWRHRLQLGVSSTAGATRARSARRFSRPCQPCDADAGGTAKLQHVCSKATGATYRGDHLNQDSRSRGKTMLSQQSFSPELGSTATFPDPLARVCWCHSLGRSFPVLSIRTIPATLPRGTRGRRLGGPKSSPPTRDRDRSVLGRRLHGSAGPQHCVWRSARHCRGLAADRGGFRHPARRSSAGCFAHLYRLRARRHRDGMACRMVLHAFDRHRVRT